MNLITYIPVGEECSAACTLKALGLRKYALPFDYIATRETRVATCIDTWFADFHQQLKPIYKSVVIDVMGIEFHHDYPETSILDGTWQKHIPEVREKYARRIARLDDILASSLKILLLRRGTYEECAAIRQSILKRYPGKHIACVIATHMPPRPEPEGMFVCYPEKTGKWNKPEIWLEAIQRAIKYLIDLG